MENTIQPMGQVPTREPQPQARELPSDEPRTSEVTNSVITSAHVFSVSPRPPSITTDVYAETSSPIDQTSRYEAPQYPKPKLTSDLPRLQPEYAEALVRTPDYETKLIKPTPTLTGATDVSSPTPFLASSRLEKQAVPAMAYEPLPITSADPSEATMPDAAQMDLGTYNIDLPSEERSTLRKIGIPVGVIVALFIVGLFVKANSAVLGSHSLKEKGYTYSFKFYRNSSTLTYGDGTTALKHDANGTIGILNPTPTADLSTCTKLGNGWKAVFDVKINTHTIPVCTPDSKTYIAVFPGAGHDQLFNITYSNVQKPDVYPVLKTMFASVNVKK